MSIFTLGVYHATHNMLQYTLSWKEQYKAIKNKRKRGLNSFRKPKNILSQRRLELVYKAIFEGHLRYGNIVCSALSNTTLSQLQRLQTRIL